MTDINATLFCRVCMTTNIRTSQCEQAKDLKALVHTRNKKYYEWLGQQDSRGEKHRWPITRNRRGWNKRTMNELAQSSGPPPDIHLNWRKAYCFGPPPTNALNWVESLYTQGSQAVTCNICPSSDVGNNRTCLINIFPQGNFNTGSCFRRTNNEEKWRDWRSSQAVEKHLYVREAKENRSLQKEALQSVLISR